MKNPLNTFLHIPQKVHKINGKIMAPLCINVRLIKNRTKHSSNTLLSLVRFFMKQTLLSYFRQCMQL